MGIKKGTTLKTDIVLGERYRDTVSGYEGVATAVYFFLHACERVLLEQWDANNAELKELAFDAPRLVHIDTNKQATTTRTGGGPNPERRSAPLR